MKDENEEAPKKVRIQALDLGEKKEKKQHMKPGHVYEVSAETADILISKGFAVKTNLKPGAYKLEGKGKKADLV